MRVGEKFPNKKGDSYIKIIAIAEGYIMARYKGCVPFVQSENDFLHRINNESNK